MNKLDIKDLVANKEALIWNFEKKAKVQELKFIGCFWKGIRVLFKKPNRTLNKLGRADLSGLGRQNNVYNI